MRGKVLAALMPENRVGITPAYAGKRLPLQDYSLVCWDHPRVCGEKSSRAVVSSFGGGSPPRMRGKGAHQPVRLLGRGITPAYAGKRWGRGVPSMRARDHPRVCGEKRARSRAVAVGAGSPPRMRGKGWRLSPCEPLRGITPAYAGKSKIVQALVHPVEDHPRVCGEKDAVGQGDEGLHGSPPRMRGKD